MAELNKRTKILSGVVVLLAAAAGAWFFLLQDDAPPPRAAVVPTAPAAKAASAASPKADAAKSADAPKADDGKAAAAPNATDAPKAADAAKPADAAKTAAAPGKPAAAKPIPTNPDQLIAEVIDASGMKTQFQVLSRETLMRSVLGDAGRVKADPADTKAMSDMVDRAFEPGKLGAEIAANLKTGLDAERMSRFLEILRQPIVAKMTSGEMRKLSPEAIQEYSDGFRKDPPPAARVKLIQSIDTVTRVSESTTEHSMVLLRDMIDTMLASLQKAGKNVPKEARQELGSRLSAARNQIGGALRGMMYVTYRSASDEELAEYVKLIDTDTGRWGMEQLANAMKPALGSRGSELGREGAQLALAKRGGLTTAKLTPVAPAQDQVVKAPMADVPAEAPVAAVVAAPAEPVGYQRAANVRELYTRYNDLISAAVMRDHSAVKELLDDGKPVNVRQADGSTPLMVAVANKDAVMAGMLLAKGADPNLRGNGGVTALSIARSQGAAGTELVQLLQRSGAKD